MRSSALSALLGTLSISILAACTTLAPSNDPPRYQGKPGLDHRRPEIIRAEVLTSDHLRLRFSEPLAAIDDVDPNDFRLSSAIGWPGEKSDPFASFLDPDRRLDQGLPLRRMSGMTGRADTLDLHLEPDLDVDFCQAINAPHPPFQAGIFLHYSPGERPITDEAGNELAGVGADWVRVGRSNDEDEAESMSLRGRSARGALDELIRLECGPIPVEASSGP